jgi:hypothetical protein
MEVLNRFNMKKYDKDYLSKKEVLYLFTMLFCMFVLGFITARVFNISRAGTTVSLPSFSVVNESDRCYGLDLLNTSDCLQKELKEFYKYNISMQHEKYSLETLKKNGGVCWHFAQWYLDRAKDIGYNSVTSIVQINKNNSHEFAIISNEEGYCVLDQNIEPKCQLLRNGEKNGK